MRRLLPMSYASLIAVMFGSSVLAQPAQQPVSPSLRKQLVFSVQPPLVLRETWRQTGPEHQVTSDAVSNAQLELKLYGPDAKDIQVAGVSQCCDRTRPDGDSPVNLWTGLCTTPVAATLRDKDNYIDLRGLAKIRWVTRVSGFHVVRPVLKLADGTWLVGDYAEGAPSTNSTVFLQTEFPLASIRWLRLDIARVVTKGTWVEKPDLGKVDEVGFADLLEGSGHGWGGFVNVGAIEVYGSPVKR